MSRFFSLAVGVLGNYKSLVIIVIFLNLCFRLSLVSVDLLNNDEAISAVAGVEIAHGGLAYKHAVDHRGPVTYYLYALAFRLGGDYNMWYVRILLSLLIAASAWILFKAVELIDPKAAALVTAIFCFMTVYGSTGDFLAFHTEWPMCFFVVLAGFGMIKIMTGSSISPLAPLGVGFSFALAVLSKQVAVFDIAAWGTVFIIYAFYQEKFRVFWINVSWMVFSFMVTLGLVVGYFYLNGGLEDFIFYVFTYNSEYYMKGKSFLSLPWDMVNQLSWFFWSRKYLLLLLLFTFLSIVFIKRGNSQVSVAKFLAASSLCFFIALIGTCLSGRPFGHYVIQLIPYISFFLGFAVFAASLRLKGNTLVPVGLILASIGFYLQFYILHTWSIKAGNAFKNDPIFSYINDHKQPQDKLFVWGFNAEPYVYTRMRPASKYSFCNFQTGLSPFINKDPWVDTRSLIVPGSREGLLSDLNRHFPAFIIDSSPANYYFYGKYPLSTFPELEAFIKKNYRRVPIENSKTYSAHLYCRKI